MKIVKNEMVLAVFLLVFLSVSTVFASETNGTIDTEYKYAWGENIGWLNFACDNCAVSVTDSALSGYALSETVGWINLDGVVNDSEGNLSGYAWGENIGYIKFDPENGGVSINSSGKFIGSALSETVGWIIFDGDYPVKTDWRPVSARTVPTTVPTNTSGSASGRRNSAIASQAGLLQTGSNVVTTVTNYAVQASNALKSFLTSITPDFSREPALTAEDVAKTESVIMAMAGKWNLISNDPINRFLFAPLPDEIQTLVNKFPELQKTFSEVGITKISDLSKLKNASFNLPNIGDKSGLTSGVSVPISKLSKEQKSALPSEVVFAKVNELTDYTINLSLTPDGQPEQTITTVVGKPIELAIKVDEPVKEIKGYLLVNNIKRQQAKAVPANSMLASPLMASLGINRSSDEIIEVEEKLVVSEFEYTYAGDNIYKAKIEAPLVYGEYEILSIIEYKKISLGKKELRLITVIDPEGYVYEKIKNKEARIPDAKVSLMWLNPQKSVFEIWPSNLYQQTNPQKTLNSGSYSFLVPEGKYKILVEADGYYNFESKEFDVEKGRGVHQNIELKPKSWWRNLFNMFK